MPFDFDFDVKDSVKKIIENGFDRRGPHEWHVTDFNGKPIVMCVKVC